jgi:hypothetical protein
LGPCALVHVTHVKERVGIRNTKLSRQDDHLVLQRSDLGQIGRGDDSSAHACLCSQGDAAFERVLELSQSADHSVGGRSVESGPAVGVIADGVNVEVQQATRPLQPARIHRWRKRYLSRSPFSIRLPRTWF